MHTGDFGSFWNTSSGVDIPFTHCPTSDEFDAYLYSHAGLTQEALSKAKEFARIPQADLQTAFALCNGTGLKISGDERRRATAAYTEFMKLCEWIEKAEQRK